MSAADSDEIIAYWLLPAEPARSFFVSLIKELARRFDAPIFAPHLTIYAAPRDNSDPDEILARVISKSETFKLLISGAQYSEEFTKTIFVQLEANDHLSDLSRGFSREAQPHHNYRLNPHLSLIYKTLPEATKKEIAASMEIPFSEIIRSR